MWNEEQTLSVLLIRFASDPQKLYNFYRSSEAETVMLGTKAPWVGVKGAFRDPRWATANTVPWAYLEYEPLDIAGHPAPPPQRNIAEPPIQALSIGAAQASRRYQSDHEYLRREPRRALERDVRCCDSGSGRVKAV